VRSGRLDPNQASALVDDVLKALRGETPELEQQAERQLERNRDHLLQDLGLARQREVDELRGRIDRLEQALRQRHGVNEFPD
jgi:polyhydroxyalkanoate synthesis regulator phasin